MSHRVILYNPKSNASGKKILPMSILAVAAVLEGRHEYCIVDGNVEREPMEALRGEIRKGAGILAVTVMPGPQLLEVIPQCRGLKQEFPNVIVVWGGYFPTLHASTCLESSIVDYVVRGHGELVFLELLNLLQSGGDCRSLPGLAYRDGGAKVVENPHAPIPHPEQLPSYPYHRIDVTRYIRSTFLGSRTLPYHSSYGCPFLCNFCAVVNMVRGRWLAQSAERVAAVAELYVKQWNVNAIEFYDNNFFTHEARVAEFARRIMPLKISWWGEARIDTLLKFPSAAWRAMKDSGLKMVFMGAESASAETLRRMDKGGTLTPDKTLEIAARTREYGIVPEFSFVVGNPPDPEEDVKTAIRFIRRLKKINPASEIIIYSYTPVALSGDLYDSALAEGFQFPKTLDEWAAEGWREFSSRRGARLPWLRESVRHRIKNFERVLNAYYPTSTDQHLTGTWRALLRAASAWRYYTGAYAFPLELRALQKLLRYQRPETSGF